MRREWSLTCLLVLLFSAPAEAEISGTNLYTFDSSHELRMDAEIVRTGDYARQSRLAADADRDGLVSADEAATFTDSMSPSTSAAIGAPVGRLYLNGNQHVETRFLSAEVKDLEGPLDVPAPVRQYLTVLFRFPEDTVPMGSLVIDTGNHSTAGHLRMPVHMARIHAPPGYAINASTGAVHGEVTPDGLSVVFPAGVRQGIGAINISFMASPPAKEMPLPWTMPLISMIGGVALGALLSKGRR